MRQPNPLKLYFDGEYRWLRPWKIPLSEMKRVHSWLGRVIQWKEEKLLRDKTKTMGSIGAHPARDDELHDRT